ncbi:MAG: hypothetical protein M3O30_07530 [Planctomycetota bacterium]|nr:hypothetical protein [Planctomycetota bacterium]
MRAIILGSMTALLIFAVGVLGQRALGSTTQIHSAVTALGIAVLGSLLAGAPMVIVRNASQIAVAQGGLAATIIHLMVMTAAAALVMFGAANAGTQFIFWLVAMYLGTLVALVAAIVRDIHAAPADAKKA